MKCWTKIVTLLRERWKRFAIYGVLSHIILQIWLNTSLFEKISSTKFIIKYNNYNNSEPTKTLETMNITISDVSYENFTSPLELLPSDESYWKSRNISHATTQCSQPIMPPNTTVIVNKDNVTFDELEEEHDNVNFGGHWHPKKCTGINRVAIIIPYRNREKHLTVFLNNIHPFLQQQDLDYAIFVVEQKPGSLFNRGLLMNIGFVEARKLYDWECYVFHDVDLLPEDKRNLYTCPKYPRHLSVAVDKFHYKLLYAQLFGGATALRNEHVLATNGFSNKFWGWGGEDDDFYKRMHYAHLKIFRYSLAIARYTMLSHKADISNPVNPIRFRLIRSGKKRYKTDGVNSVKYKLLKLEAKRLFTWIYIIDAKI